MEKAARRQNARSSRFAEYLLHRTLSVQESDVRQSLSELDQASLNHLEDEFRDYRKIYPHE